MGVIILIIIVLAAWWASQNLAVMKLCKGKTEDQKKVIKYLYGGFLVFGKINDQQYDELVLQTVKNLNLDKKALDKCGIDEDQIFEIDPITFQGFDCDGKLVSDLGVVFLGKQDSKLRSTEYEWVRLFFTDSQVLMYKHHIDMVSDSQKVNTEEYFYKDITNFSTQDETVEAFQIKTGCSGKEKSRVKKNKEYSRFGLIVPGDKFYCSTTNSENVDTTISAMKQKLREKKTS